MGENRRKEGEGERRDRKEGGWETRRERRGKGRQTDRLTTDRDVCVFKECIPKFALLR